MAGLFFYSKFQPGLTKRSEFMYSPVKYYFGLTDNGYGVGWVVFVKIKDWLRKSISGLKSS